MEHEPVTVRKLLFKHGAVWAGDEMGSLCRWTPDLTACTLKKEYYTEIWSFAVSNDNKTVYTVRDNEIIVADISSGSSNTVLVNYTLPGRAPVVLDTCEDTMVCPTRGGMELLVRRKCDNSGSGPTYKDVQLLKKHDMIINTVLLQDGLLLSAGWDARLVFWVSLL